MSKECTVTPGQILFPISLVAFVLALSLAFQTTQIVSGNEALKDAKSQQDKPLEETSKVQAQLNAIALGTKKLADGGNKDAQAIIAKMKQAGINIGENPPAGSAPSAKPAASPSGK